MIADIPRACWAAKAPRAKPYLLKAVALNPKLAKAYEELSFDAERWGDENAARDFMGKAAKAEPTEASYSFYYADFFREADPAKYVSLSLDVVKRFPSTERGAQALYWLGENSTSDADKVTYWEQDKALFPPTSSDGRSTAWRDCSTSMPEPLRTKRSPWPKR